MFDFLDFLVPALSPLAQLGGVVAVAVLLTGILKRLGVVKDGQSQAWQGAINFVIAVLAYVAVQTGGDLATIDSSLLQAAKIGRALLEFVAAVVASPLLYKGAKALGLPLAGFSFGAQGAKPR